MKKLVNIVLVLCVCALAYVCVGSIMGSINFGKEREAREKVIIARLIDIRTAQVAFRDQNNGQYTGDFDELIDFVKNDSLPFVKKVGELTDKQLEDGWTESKAMKLIDDARKAKRPADAKKKWQEAEKAGFVKICPRFCPQIAGHSKKIAVFLHGFVQALSCGFSFAGTTALELFAAQRREHTFSSVLPHFFEFFHCFVAQSAGRIAQDPQ